MLPKVKDEVSSRAPLVTVVLFEPFTISGGRYDARMWCPLCNCTQQSTASCDGICSKSSGLSFSNDCPPPECCTNLLSTQRVVNP
ncbi:hypothetical protein CAURIC_07670 [Corynebacterium auriscanis]|nr:hypothetical protein CAURIC_07670 [Corynebacterium auriscanis]